MRPLTVLGYFALLSLLLSIWAYVLRSVWAKTSKLRSALLKLSVSVSTLSYLFLLLELVFYAGFAVSDTFGFTLAAHRWQEKYWQPINSLGYRDVEHSPAEFGAKDVLLVVGDSFVAGHGITRIENRFSDILQRNLNAQYVVVNIAQNGWNTTEEYGAIVACPYRPKRIILAYYLNDILGAAQRLGYGSPVRVELPQSRALRYVIEHSYFLNFVYWRLYRFHNRELGEQYWAYLQNSYAHPSIWAEHETELNRIVTYTRAQKIDLIVVVFPNLRAIKSSAPFTSRVADFFRQHNVRALDLAPLLADRDPQGLVVNSLDAHPNEALHMEVATLLTGVIRSELKE